jgi:hypothetical protein
VIRRQGSSKRRVLAGAVISGALLIVVVIVVIVRAVDGGGDGRLAPRATSTSSPVPSGATASDSAAPTAASSEGTAVPSPSLGTPRSLGSGAPEPIEPVKTKKAVPLNTTGDFGTGLTVRLSSIAAVKGTATVPGEIAGPAIKLTVVARNGADRAVDLNSVVVFVSFGRERTPASELSEGARPLTGRVAPDDSRTGTYIYTVPEDEREQLRVEISYSGKAPTVAFEGAVES